MSENDLQKRNWLITKQLDRSSGEVRNDFILSCKASAKTKKKEALIHLLSFKRIFNSFVTDSVFAKP
jgi:hypothetical protein